MFSPASQPVPILAGLDRVDRVSVHSVASGQKSRRSTAIQFSAYLLNFLSHQLLMRVAIAAYAIHAVLVLVADHKMLGVHARRVVAMVANNHAFWYRRANEFHDDVRSTHVPNPFKWQDGVSVLSAERPFPAASGPVTFGDLLSEPRLGPVRIGVTEVHKAVIVLLAHPVLLHMRRFVTCTDNTGRVWTHQGLLRASGQGRGSGYCARSAHRSRSGERVFVL